MCVRTCHSEHLCNCPYAYSSSIFYQILMTSISLDFLYQEEQNKTFCVKIQPQKNSRKNHFFKVSFRHRNVCLSEHIHMFVCLLLPHFPLCAKENKIKLSIWRLGHKKKNVASTFSLTKAKVSSTIKSRTPSVRLFVGQFVCFLSIFLSVSLFIQTSVCLFYCLNSALPEGRAKWPAKPAYLRVYPKW